MKDKNNEEEFEPHPMYEPKTGKFMMADTMEEHLIFKEIGLVHEDELKEKPEKNPKDDEVIMVSFVDAVEKGMDKKE
tara:strand:+ start:47725 stop:47955 length:231 start_codon:yes stop_codon:yes gene_type:complete